MRDGWAYDPLDDEPCAACGHIFGDHRDDDRTCGHWDSDMGTVCSCTGFEPNDRHGGGRVSGSDPRPAREILADSLMSYIWADDLLAALEAEGWRVLRDDTFGLIGMLTQPIPHRYCDDCWYSCPKATQDDGSSAYCGDKPRDVCDCGADAHNKAAARLRELVDLEPVASRREDPQ
jgi:hypothetical protein